MMKILKLMAIVACIVSVVMAQRITESLDTWTLGTTPPEISSGTRGDGTTGGYLHMLVGASPMYYEVMTEGEGMVEFWVYDPGNCLENTDPGYGLRGPKWGLQSPLYQYASVGIDRASQVSGCQGYSPYSSVSPYSPWWFFDGARASHEQPFTPGWYKWSASGTWDSITFTLYNIYFRGPMGGGPDPDWATGDATGTMDAAYAGGSWAALFGEGWKAFWVKGDEASGIEDVNVDVTGGSGVFSEFGEVGISRAYTPESWANIKMLFR